MIEELIVKTPSWYILLCVSIAIIYIAISHLKEIRELLHWIGFHKWNLIKKNRNSHYYECSICGKREVRMSRSGYFPIDWDWLGGGDWEVMTPPRKK